MRQQHVNGVEEVCEPKDWRRYMNKAIFSLFIPSTEKKILKLQKKINIIENYISFNNYKRKKLEKRLTHLMDKKKRK